MKEFTIGIAGNPYVGKSTLLNGLSGRNQRTSNWPGTTIPQTKGKYLHGEIVYNLIDLPGVYSLTGTSKEEEIVRDFICYDSYHAIVMVCDATSFEQNLVLLLETLEITGNVILCVNFMDKAKRSGLTIDVDTLKDQLQIPIIPTIASKLEGLLELIDCLDESIPFSAAKGKSLVYEKEIEEATNFLVPYIEDHLPTPLPSTWIARCLLSSEKSFLHSLEEEFNISIFDDLELQTMLLTIQSTLECSGIDSTTIRSMISSTYAAEASRLYSEAFTVLPTKRNYLSERLSKLINRTT